MSLWRAHFRPTNSCLGPHCRWLFWSQQHNSMAPIRWSMALTRTVFVCPVCKWPIDGQISSSTTNIIVSIISTLFFVFYFSGSYNWDWDSIACHAQQVLSPSATHHRNSICRDLSGRELLGNSCPDSTEWECRGWPSNFGSRNTLRNSTSRNKNLTFPRNLWSEGALDETVLW